MDVLKGMQAFVATVEEGSFVAAADQLDTSTAAISRQVSALEDHLGVRLINRTTRRLSLTEPGQLYFERAGDVLRDISETEALIGEHAVRPGGLLRVSAPLAFGIRALGRLLPEFQKLYPDLTLDIDLTDRVSDLAHEGVDVALRIAREPSPNLIARRIGPVRSVACASPGYLERHGVPLVPEDLEHHKTLSYTYQSSGDRWVFHDAAGNEHSVRVRSCVRATNGDLLRDLAVADRGIIVQPLFIVGSDIAAGRLVPILTNWSFPESTLYAVYLSRKFLSAKVRVFIDFLAAEIGKDPRSILG